MTYPKTKIDIVNTILPLLQEDPDSPWKDFTADKLVFDWFVTGRAGSGLRLTDAGKTVFENAKIAHYDFDFKPPNNTRSSAAWGKFTMLLDKKVKCPYYIGVRLAEKDKKQPYIRLYDNKIAMMMALYGDLESYIESTK
jgi:hypothetical protein